MAGTIKVEDKDLRAENINRAVIGFALQEYRFKPICLVEKSSSWKETYFKEGADFLGDFKKEATEYSDFIIKQLVKKGSLEK